MFSHDKGYVILMHQYLGVKYAEKEGNFDIFRF